MTTLEQSFEASKRKLLEAASIAIEIAQRDYADTGKTSEHWESQDSITHARHLVDHIYHRDQGYNGEDHDSHLVIRALMYYFKVMQEEAIKMDAVVNEDE